MDCDNFCNLYSTTIWLLRVQRVFHFSLQGKIPYPLIPILLVLMLTGVQTIIYQDYCLAYSDYKTPLTVHCIPSSETLKEERG